MPNDEAKMYETTAAANLLTKYIERLDLQKLEVSEAADSITTQILERGTNKGFENPDIVEFQTMVNTVANLCGDDRTRIYLVRKLSELIRQSTWDYPNANYTKLIINQLLSAVVSAVSGHNASWESEMKMALLKILGNVRVMDEQVHVERRFLEKMKSFFQREGSDETDEYDGGYD